MLQSKDPVIGAPLSHRLSADADVAQISVALVAIWRDIDAVLDPIMGERGVAALFQRSLQLSSTVHPHLMPGLAAAPNAPGEQHLQALLAGRNPPDAVATGNDFLLTFQRLLASLVGTELTEQLLRPAWTARPGPSTAKDPAS